MFLVVVALLLAPRAQGSEAPPTLDRQVDALFAGSVHSDTPGAAVLVARNGKIAFEKGYGLANVDASTPITCDTRFRIGSITKQFTAAAVLRLAEQGRLRIDDPLSRFVPDWPRGNQVTLRHLLTHSSGIHNFTAKPGFAVHVREPISLEKLVASFKNDPYDFNPGEKYSYSNSGYVLLGWIIEKVSGESYETYLRKTFFEPLGMKDTGVYPSGGGLPKEALGYSFENGAIHRAVDWDMSNVATAGEIYSTAHDLFRWNEALFSQKVISARSMHDAFTVGVLKDDDPTHPQDTGYGLGWTIDRLNGAREISHGGELAGFGSYLLRLPDYNLTVVVLLNCVPQQPGLQQWVLARQIARLALGRELPQEAKPKIAANISAADLQAIVGQYNMGNGLTMSVTVESGHVFVQTAGRKRFEIFPESDRDFFVESGAAQATFVRNANSQVVKAILKQAGDRIDAPKIAGK
ncbi:MAG TPA: serine hydrolase [Tepidisphaeraceae bacterium]|nr:serine hydrolase [Tepidisphaeraceae bacterium]